MNPYNSLVDIITGVLAGDVATGDGRMPELELAPELLCGLRGEYQTRVTRLKYNKRLNNADRAMFGAGRRKVTSLEYDTHALAPVPFETDVVRLSKEEVELITRTNPDVSPLEDGRVLIREAIQGRIAEEVATQIATLTNLAINLATASTNVGLLLRTQADNIAKTTGARPDTIGVGPEAVTSMLFKNTLIASHRGSSVGAPGATTGNVTPEALAAYLQETAGLRLVVLDRSIIETDDSDAFQWSNTGYMGVSKGGKAPSCLKTATPRAGMFEVEVGDLAFENGGGVGIVAKATMQCFSPDTDLGRKITWTL